MSYDEQLKSLIKTNQDNIKQQELSIELYKNQINNLFTLTTYKNYATIEEDYSKLMNFEIETPSIINLILLNIQLNKSKLIDINFKLNSINHVIEKYHTKIEKLRDETKSKKYQVDRLIKEIEIKRVEIEKSYEKESKEVEHKFDHIQNVRIIHTKQQFKNTQVIKFDTLNEYNFQNYNSNKKFLFNYQPILKMDEFLSYNLVIINQFLERLIMLQVHLNKIFEFKLPYLNELIKYLPSQDFYNLIQRKELMIVGKSEEEEAKTSIHPENIDDIKDIVNSDEKILKLGNRYRLPLSSKTLNYQRRAKNSITPEDLNNIPIIKNNSSTPSTRKTNDTTSTSKKIIIPHKIINKPFNKLSIKDFLKFLIIIVKIIINFQMFLKHNPSQFQLLNSEHFNWCDFESVLAQIIEFKSYFTNNPENHLVKLPRIDRDLKNEMFQNLLDSVYKQLMNNPRSKPIQLQELNLKNLFANFHRKHNHNTDNGSGNDNDDNDSWDIISEMLLL